MTFDPSFGTAKDAVDAIRNGVISSRELTAHLFERIRKHNPKLNLFITLIEDRAMARAAQVEDRVSAFAPLVEAVSMRHPWLATRLFIS